MILQYFELYFHLGLALQQIEEHTKAVAQYTKSIEAISTQKVWPTNHFSLPRRQIDWIRAISIYLYRVTKFYASRLTSVDFVFRDECDFKKKLDLFIFMLQSGCMGDCGNTSCLMTPVFARRAFANAKSGMINPLNESYKKILFAMYHGSDGSKEGRKSPTDQFFLNVVIFFHKIWKNILFHQILANPPMINFGYYANYS